MTESIHTGDVVLVATLAVLLVVVMVAWWCWPVLPSLSMLRRRPRRAESLSEEIADAYRVPRRFVVTQTRRADEAPLPPLHALPLPRTWAEACEQRAPYVRAQRDRWVR